MVSESRRRRDDDLERSFGNVCNVVTGRALGLMALEVPVTNVSLR